MNKLFLRLTVCLLVPCLLQEPVLALAHSGMPHAVIHISTFFFENQALATPEVSQGGTHYPVARLHGWASIRQWTRARPRLRFSSVKLSMISVFSLGLTLPVFAAGTGPSSHASLGPGIAVALMGFITFLAYKGYGMWKQKGRTPIPLSIPNVQREAALPSEASPLPPKRLLFDPAIEQISPDDFKALFPAAAKRDRLRKAAPEASRKALRAVIHALQSSTIGRYFPESKQWMDMLLHPHANPYASNLCGLGEWTLRWAIADYLDMYCPTLSAGQFDHFIHLAHNQKRKEEFLNELGIGTAYTHMEDVFRRHFVPLPARRNFTLLIMGNLARGAHFTLIREVLHPSLEELRMKLSMSATSEKMDTPHAAILGDTILGLTIARYLSHKTSLTQQEFWFEFERLTNNESLSRAYRAMHPQKPLLNVHTTGDRFEAEVSELYRSYRRLRHEDPDRIFVKTETFILDAYRKAGLIPENKEGGEEGFRNMDKLFFILFFSLWTVTKSFAAEYSLKEFSPEISNWVLGLSLGIVALLVRKTIPASKRLLSAA